MFTTNNRTIRTAAIVTFAAATLIPTLGFSAPKRDVSHGRNKTEMTEVRLTHPSNPPSDSGDTTIRVGEMRKKDPKNTTELAGSGFDVRIVHPSNPPAGSEDTTIRVGEMRSDAAASPAADAGRQAASRSFVQAMDLSSGGRWVAGTASPAPSHNPFTDGRTWISLTRDGDSGLVATAGLSFLLK